MYFVYGICILCDDLRWSYWLANKIKLQRFRLPAAGAAAKSIVNSHPAAPCLHLPWLQKNNNIPNTVQTGTLSVSVIWHPTVRVICSDTHLCRKFGGESLHSILAPPRQVKSSSYSVHCWCPPSRWTQLARRPASMWSGSSWCSLGRPLWILRRLTVAIRRPLHAQPPCDRRVATLQQCSPVCGACRKKWEKRKRDSV